MLDLNLIVEQINNTNDLEDLERLKKEYIGKK